MFKFLCYAIIKLNELFKRLSTVFKILTTVWFANVPSSSSQVFFVQKNNNSAIKSNLIISMMVLIDFHFAANKHMATYIKPMKTDSYIGAIQFH